MKGKNKFDEKLTCPECGHELKHKEYHLDKDTNMLVFECPDCGWSGGYLEMICEDDEEDY